MGFRCLRIQSKSEQSPGFLKHGVGLRVSGVRFTARQRSGRTKPCPFDETAQFRSYRGCEVPARLRCRRAPLTRSRHEEWYRVSGPVYAFGLRMYGVGCRVEDLRCKMSINIYIQKYIWIYVYVYLYIFMHINI